MIDPFLADDELGGPEADERRIGHMVVLLRMLGKLETMVEEMLDEPMIDQPQWQDLVRQVKWLDQWAQAAEDL